MTATVLEFWLSSLDMRGYHQAFLDNGYDDLEICKKVRKGLGVGYANMGRDFVLFVDGFEKILHFYEDFGGISAFSVAFSCSNDFMA